jgi:hypothetical protein
MNGLVFSGDILVYLVGLAATWGAAMWRISALEKKMDKHNCLIERMAVAERNIEDFGKRLEKI